MESIKTFFNNYLSWLAFPTLSISVVDIIEILILSYIVYRVLGWIRVTRAWTLLKGILLLGVFISLAYIFEMNTIKFIVNKGVSIAFTAAVVVFQPELRKALEHLGEKRLFTTILPFDFEGVKDVKERFSDKTVNELIKATFEMGETKTGALIVIEKNETLSEYERTGIDVDAILTSQMLINIFEHNTPLHDGAVLVRGDRIVSATCYLPLSDSMELSKELGTRHRAAVGISEVTDSLTIIVSEESGNVSIASKGKLVHGIDAVRLREQLVILQNKTKDMKKFKLWKGKSKNEENDF